MKALAASCANAREKGWQPKIPRKSAKKIAYCLLCWLLSQKKTKTKNINSSLALQTFLYTEHKLIISKHITAVQSEWWLLHQKWDFRSKCFVLSSIIIDVILVITKLFSFVNGQRILIAFPLTRKPITKSKRIKMTFFVSTIINLSHVKQSWPIDLKSGGADEGWICCCGKS